MGMMNMSFELLKEFAVLSERKKELEEQLADVKEKIGNIEEQIINFMVDNELSTTKIGNITIYTSEVNYAKPLIPKTEFIEKLKDTELGYLVKEGYNTNQFYASVRALKEKLEFQLEKEGKLPTISNINEVLPKQYKELFEIAQGFKLKARKG